MYNSTRLKYVAALTRETEILKFVTFQLLEVVQQHISGVVDKVKQFFIGKFRDFPVVKEL